MITAREIAQLLDRKGTYATRDGLTIAVVISDARESFGRLQVLITPQEGTGTIWVDAERVRMDG